VLTLKFRTFQIIRESTLSEENKKSLIDTYDVALFWTKEQKELYSSAVTEWDKNHPKVPVFNKDGSIIWVEDKTKMIGKN